MKKQTEKAPEEKTTQIELDKLVEQKQKETKALKGFIQVLGKMDAKLQDIKL